VLAAPPARSLEIVKGPDADGVRLLASAPPGGAPYPAETGRDCSEAAAAAPEWARRDGALALDAEPSLQLTPVPLAPPARLLNQPVRTVASRRGEGIWAQAVFASGSLAPAPGGGTV